LKITFLILKYYYQDFRYQIESPPRELIHLIGHQCNEGGL